MGLFKEEKKNLFEIVSQKKENEFVCKNSELALNNDIMAILQIDKKQLLYRET